MIGSEILSFHQCKIVCFVERDDIDLGITPDKRIDLFSLNTDVNAHNDGKFLWDTPCI